MEACAVTREGGLAARRPWHRITAGEKTLKRMAGTAMDLTCKQCGAAFRAIVPMPLAHAVRVGCPACGRFLLVRPANGSLKPSGEQATPRRVVIADEPREFRNFLGKQLTGLGFVVEYFDTGEGLIDYVRKHRVDLIVVNVYLRGKLGVDVSEEIKATPDLASTKVVLIGALFRANRFRANPTNLYGADDYIEERIPARELRMLIQRLFSEVEPPSAGETKEFSEAKRLARLILSDIVIYNAEKVEASIRNGTFFEVLRAEIEDGQQYYESKVPFRIRQGTEYFTETLQQFVTMKMEELMRNGIEMES